MQPYFLPYPGYFALIARSDRWLVFDDAQMIRHGWVNRNRVLHPTEAWQYIRVPVVGHERGALIREIEVADLTWGKRIVGQLAPYRRAPHYAAVVALLEQVAARELPRLLDVNLALLAAICERIGVRFAPELHSELTYDRAKVQGPGDWALEAGRALGAASYINPPGGRELFDRARFQEAGMRLEFLTWETPPYAQGARPFEAHLSIIDMLMFLPPEQVRARLDAAQVEVATPA
ncbi:MAG: WbqC family protein [Planctomycetota bacterium]